MIRRDLLVEQKVDSTGGPVYVMNYDLDGWDKAVSDGRWIRGKWLLLKRNWLLILFTFIVTAFISTLENRMVGFIDNCIDSVTATDETNDVKNNSTPEKSENETDSKKIEPNKAVNPSGGSGGN